MEDRSLNKALDIYSALITGQNISLHDKATSELYNAFYADSEVYDITTKMLTRQGLKLYEYNESLFVILQVNRYLSDQRIRQNR